ncbi:MAG: right-handed parallel beta-helix repeat-containing protein [Saprospiraceae bacterium]|nr:right-handed parallel beta-helix repeat-containing protein [Saprospiraceae bacterium]
MNFTIRDNDITTEVKASGIFLSGSNGMDISGNTILLGDEGSEDRGFFAQSFHSGLLRYNTLRGSEIGSQIGVAVLFGQGSEYYCNATDSLGKGFVYIANCDNSYLGTNLIGNHLVGLDLLYGGGQFTRIGYQPNTMNQWLANEDYGVAGARHYSNDEFVTKSSQFDVHTTSNSYWPDPLIDPSTMWFHEAGSAGDDCQVPVPDEDWRSMNVLTSLDSLIISGDTTTYSGESLWSLRHSLCWKLYHNPGIRAASSWADDWFVHSDQDNLASLVMSEYLLSGGHSQIDSMDIENELDQINAYFSILHRLYDLDSLMSDDPQPGWITERDSLLNIWVGMNELDSLVWEELLARMDSSKAMASTILNGMSSSSLTEQRWQQVLELYLDFLESGSEAWDSLERVALVEIAEMCIGDGGPATPWARILVELFEPDFHDDIILCIEQSSLVQSNGVNDGSTISPSLYPNPFVEFLTLDTDCISGQFILSNLLGQTVYHADIPESQCQVRLVGLGVLAAGIYHWKFKTHDGRHATGTVVRD